jgi:hypothetical protein
VLTGVALFTAVLFVAALSLVVISSRSSSTSGALAAARQFLDAHPSARFVDEATSKYESLTHQVRSSDTGRWRSEGEVQLPNRGRLIVSDARGAREHLVLGEEAFTRQAASRDALRTTPWVRSLSNPTGPRGWTAISDARFDRGRQPGVDVPDPASVPLNLPTVVDALSLSKARRADGGVLTATVRVADLAIAPHGSPASGASSDNATITFTARVARNGRIDWLEVTRVLDLGGDQETEHHRFTFTDWGAPVSLAAPTGVEVDATPTIDEASLARVTGMTVLSPRPMPEPWRLVRVDVVPADGPAEECQSVTLTYLSRTLVVANYLATDADPPTVSITSLAADCPWLDHVQPDLARFRARPAFAGQLPVHLVDSPDANTYSYLSSGWTAVATAGTTYVLATTNWADAELLRLLARLAPLDLAGERLADDDLMRLAG